MGEPASEDGAQDLLTLETLVHVEGWGHNQTCEPLPTSTTTNISNFDKEFMLYDCDLSRDYHQDGGLQGLNIFNDSGMSQILFEKASSPQLRSNGQTDSPGLGDTFVHITSDETSSAGRGSLDSVQNASNCAIMQRLSALVAEMHESWRVLKEGPWTKAIHGHDLNDYPIGGVLHLSQEFANILHTISWTMDVSSQMEANSRTPIRCAECNIQGCVPPPGKSSPNTHSSSLVERPTPSIDTTDTPTMLLIFSCYISLTRIYSIVFGHFQDYLSLLPSTFSQSTAGVELRRGLQLGALPPTNEAYSRTHTAVRMLLDMLQCAEDIIGLPSNLRCAQGLTTRGDSASESELTERAATAGAAAGAPSWLIVEGDLAMAVLKQDALIGAGSMQEGFSRLGKKIGVVKNILREKMDL